MNAPARRPVRTTSAVTKPVIALWRRLTSMRTALILLFLLAVAAVPGSLLPQRNLNPSAKRYGLHQGPRVVGPAS